MNRYQKQRSKEIKQIMKRDKFGRMKYTQARRVWNWTRRFSWCRPCEDCCTMCNGPYKVIAYCPKNT